MPTDFDLLPSGEDEVVDHSTGEIIRRPDLPTDEDTDEAIALARQMVSDAQTLRAYCAYAWLEGKYEQAWFWTGHEKRRFEGDTPEARFYSWLEYVCSQAGLGASTQSGLYTFCTRLIPLATTHQIDASVQDLIRLKDGATFRIASAIGRAAEQYPDPVNRRAVLNKIIQVGLNQPREMLETVLKTLGLVKTRGGDLSNQANAWVAPAGDRRYFVIEATNDKQVQAVIKALRSIGRTRFESNVEDLIDVLRGTYDDLGGHHSGIGPEKGKDD